MEKFLLETFGDRIVYAVIFGSQVYGTMTPDSDTDLYVVLEMNEINEEKHYDKIDITLISYKQFLHNLEENEVKAIESIFVPEKFVIIGDQTKYQKLFVVNGQKLRHTFGSVCRQAWNRGIKKLTLEKTDHEHKVGRKSLFHAIRLFICAIELVENKKLDFEKETRIKESIIFYNEIKNLSIEDIIIDNKLKQSYVDLYKKYDKEFKKVVN